MKRIAPWIFAIGIILSFGLPATFAADACQRADLKAMVGKYFTALEARDPSQLPLAANVKFTENGVVMPVGQGLWKTAGKVLLKRDLLDTEKCGTHSNVVLEEKYVAPKTSTPKPKATGPMAMFAAQLPEDGAIRPILFGVRLKVDNGKISEIESFVARETEFAFNAKAVLATRDQDWESIIPLSERSSRLQMIAAADDYYDMFSNEPAVHTPFARPCDRWENGTITTAGRPGGETAKLSGMDVNLTAHDCSPKGLVITNHGPRRFLVDVEAGTVVAYVLFAGGLPDFHMFRMRGGKVDLIQSVIGAGAKDMGWPNEAVCK